MGEKKINKTISSNDSLPQKTFLLNNKLQDICMEQIGSAMGFEWKLGGVPTITGHDTCAGACLSVLFTSKRITFKLKEK